MPAFNYRAKIYFEDATLKTVEGIFETDFLGASALDALLAVLRLLHEKDGHIPSIGVLSMHITNQH